MTGQTSEGLFDRLNYDNRCRTRECGDYDRESVFFFVDFLFDTARLVLREKSKLFIVLFIV